MTTEAAETPVQPALTAKQSGQNPRSAAVEAASVTVVKDNAHEEPTDVMSAVLERPNMQRAYARVLRNKGAPGVDGMKVGDLKDYLKAHWPTHKQELLDGTYQPQAGAEGRNTQARRWQAPVGDTHGAWTGSSSRHCIRC